MKLTIKYTSQIALAANTDEEQFETSKSTLLDLIKEISIGKSQMFQELLWNQANQISPSVLIIVNGNQIQDLKDAQIKEGDEIMLFSPMSGG